MTVSEWITLIVIILIVAVLIIAWWVWYVAKTKRSHKSLEELHEEQLEGSLEREEKLEEAYEEKVAEETAKSGEAIKSEEVAKPAETVKPDEPVKPTETAKPAVAAKPAETEKSSEVTESKETEKSEEVIKPEETEKPEETTKSGEGTKPEETEKSSTSHLVQLRKKLAENNSLLGRALLNILSRKTLDESAWQEMEDTLLLADMGVDSSEQIVSNLRKELQIKGGTPSSEEVKELFKKELLKEVQPQLDRQLVALTPEFDNKLCVTMMVGVNGTGKTTTAGKLARYLTSHGKKVAFVAADTFRAAAADQLETWAKPLHITVTRAQKDGADPASIAYEGVENAEKEKADVLLVDTAGRLQTKKNLMDELGKIRRVIEKRVPVAEVLLVLDATTGQNGLSQAKIFSEAIGITGVVLTKLDGSAKGGIVVAVQKELGVPVKLVGLGEGPHDLAPFDAEDFVDGIVGD